MLDRNQTSPMAELHRLHAELFLVNEILKMAAFAADASLVLKPARPYSEGDVLRFIGERQDSLVQALTEAASQIGRDGGEG